MRHDLLTGDLVKLRAQGAGARFARSHQLAAGFLVACLLGSAGAVAAGTDAATASHEETVRLSPGDEHTYHLQLAPQQAVELSLRQLRNNAQLESVVLDGADSTIVRSDAGRGTVLHLTLLAGDVAWAGLLRVTPAVGSHGADYALIIGPAHPATTVDRQRHDGDLALAAAEALRRGGPHEQIQTKAATLYQEAIRDFGAAHDDCRLRSAYLGDAQWQMAGSAYHEAQLAAESALQQSCAGDTAGEALAERIRGSAIHNQGDFARGAAVSERALALFQRTGDADNLAVTLGNLGLMYREMGENTKAQETAQAALRYAEAAGNGKVMVFVGASIAYMQEAAGEFAAALASYQRTLESLHSTPYPMVEGTVLTNLGYVYRELGDHEAARDAYARAEDFCSGHQLWLCLAAAQSYEAQAQLEDGDTATAASTYHRALATATAHDDVRGEADALRGLGRCAIESKRWDEARSLLDEALRKIDSIHEPANKAFAYAALGDLDSRSGKLDAARQDYDHALDLARQLADRGGQATYLASLARLDQQTGQLQEARTAAARSLELIESERGRIDEPSLRTSYFNSKRSYYALYIDILMQLDYEQPGHGYAAQALIASERARARSLQDMLAERTQTLDDSIDPLLLATQNRAEDRLRQAAQDLDLLPVAASSAQRQTLQNKVDSAARELDAARGRVRAANPRYSELANPRTPTLQELQQRLPRGAAALEFWLGEQKSYLWVLTGKALHSYPLPPRAQLDAQALHLHEVLTTAPQAVEGESLDRFAARAAAQLDTVQHEAQDLGGQLLGAAAASLRESRQLVIVADGALHLLPFALLGSGEGEHSEALINEHELTHLPSLTTLRWLQDQRAVQPRDPHIALLADPVFRADDSRLKLASASTSAPPVKQEQRRGTSQLSLNDLPRLPYSREEAETIARLFPTGRATLDLDFDASRNSVLHTRWASYSIAHFATHTLLDLRQPELSGVVLSLYDRSGRAEDGFLRMADIYKLKLPENLVVLSACESASGKDVGTEGVYSLARAFFYAGTPRVLGSLWTVDDRASAAFMELFYRALLQSNMRPTQALRAAQLALSQQPRWRAPYYWAGYVLQGDWR